MESNILTDDLSVDEMRKLSIFLDDAACALRGESGKEMRFQLSRFQKLKSLKAKREALRRAHQIWLCP